MGVQRPKVGLVDRLLPFMLSVPQHEVENTVLEADRQPHQLLSSNMEEGRPSWEMEGTPLEEEDQPPTSSSSWGPCI